MSLFVLALALATSPATPPKPILAPTISEVRGSVLTLADGGIRIPPKSQVADGGIRIPSKKVADGGIRIPPKNWIADGGIRIPPKNQVADGGIRIPPKRGASV
jgi:hypothetical protein